MDIPSSVFVWLYEWQTLAAGLLALAAAGISFLAINRQIRQSERHERDRIRRAFDAARAVLPLTLDRIGAYARQSTDYTLAILSANSGNLITSAPTEPPEFPVLATEEIRRLIEVCPNEGLRKRLGRLVAELQVQHARMIDNHASITPAGSTIVMRSNMVSACLDALNVNAQTMTLFDFARGESETVSDTIEWQDVQNSSGFLMLDGSGKEVFEEFKRRRDSGQTPTILD